MPRSSIRNKRKKSTPVGFEQKHIWGFSWLLSVLGNSEIPPCSLRGNAGPRQVNALLIPESWSWCWFWQCDKGLAKHKWFVEEAGLCWLCDAAGRNIWECHPLLSTKQYVPDGAASTGTNQLTGPFPQQMLLAWAPAVASKGTFHHSFMLKLIPVQQVRIRPRANASIALESHNEGLRGAQTGEYPVPKARVLSSSKFQNTASIRALPAFLSSAQHKTPCWNGHKPSAGLAESIDQQSCIWPWVWFGRKLGFACVIPLRIYMLQHH